MYMQTFEHTVLKDANKTNAKTSSERVAEGHAILASLFSTEAVAA